MNISLVPYGAVSGVVPALLPFLTESQGWTRGRASVDDILRFILTGQMQLWAVHDEQSIYGHFITEIKQYPQCKLLAIQYCAMTPGTMECVENDKTALFAKDMGCAGIEFVGRPGWRKTANKYG